MIDRLGCTSAASTISTQRTSTSSGIHGLERDPWGNDRVGLEVRGTINRRDFGLR
jgi:polyisoprenoid-binding protein YceI